MFTLTYSSRYQRSYEAYRNGKYYYKTIGLCFGNEIYRTIEIFPSYEYFENYIQGLNKGNKIITLERD
jgi:hypothetical protein